MGNLFNAYLYQPILWVLVFIYQHLSFGDLGIAIILLTVFVRLVLFPIFYKGAKDQALMQRLQPKIQEIQREHKDNREVQAKALMALYREHRLNPLSGFLLILLQLPVFIALFGIFSKELTSGLFDNLTFLGLINLQEASIPVAVVAALFQYVQGKMSLPPHTAEAGGKQNPMASMGRMMVFLGPVLTIVVLQGLPAALGIYWIVSTLFSIAQQAHINRKLRAAGSGGGAITR